VHVVKKFRASGEHPFGKEVQIKKCLRATLLKKYIVRLLRIINNNTLSPVVPTLGGNDYLKLIFKNFVLT
jgi:hypothetical protein